MAIYLHLSPSNAVKKKKAFRVAAVLLVAIPSVLAVDIYLRLTASYPYVLGELAYRRPAHTSFDGAYEDIPEAVRTYPHAPPGFGKVTWKLSTDRRGFATRPTTIGTKSSPWAIRSPKDRRSRTSSPGRRDSRRRAGCRSATWACRDTPRSIIWPR